MKFEGKVTSVARRNGEVAIVTVVERPESAFPGKHASVEVPLKDADAYSCGRDVVVTITPKAVR